MKRKVNINRPDISSEEIANRMDFEKVLKAHQAVAKPFYKSTWFITSTVIVAAATVGLVLVLNSNLLGEPDGKNEPGLVEQTSYMPNDDLIQDDMDLPFINPPLEGVDIAYTNYKVNAQKGSEFEHSTGSKISIPSDCFVDDNGKVVKGEVDVRYREFHDPVDFFVSGIPMTYDSAGHRYHFESAGMLEIYAFKDGQVLKMNPDKAIDVQLASQQTGTDYNLYSLDTAARNWNFLGKDKVIEPELAENIVEDLMSESSTSPTQPVSWATQEVEVHTDNIPEPWEHPELVKIKKEIRVIQDTIGQMKKREPIVPKKADPEKYRFNIDVNAKEFPELEEFKGLQFQVGDENTDFTSEMYKTVWEDASLKEKKKGENYYLQLTKGKKRHTFVVYPVFEGKEYAYAKQQFDKKFSRYNTKLDKRKADEKAKQEEYERKKAELEEQIAEQLKQWAEQQRKWEESRQKAMAKLKETNPEYYTNQQVMRAFTIEGFGVYNCDRPSVYPKGARAIAQFVDDKQNELETMRNYYLVVKGRNAIFTYFDGQKDKHSFTYNPKQSTQLWGVTLDGELAIYNYEAFATNKPKGSVAMQMKVVEAELDSPEDVRKYIEI